MSLERKLKPDRNMTGFIVHMSPVPVVTLVFIVFGPEAGLAALVIWMGFFFLYYLYEYLRTWNLSRLFVVVYAAYIGIVFSALLGIIQVNTVSRPEFEPLFFFSILFFGSVLIFLVATRRFKWRGREVFELAGEAVEQVGDGYTNRPRPVGKVVYSPEQIRGFARYVARHLIALPFFTSKNVTLVPVKMGDEFGRMLGLIGDYRDATWVNFDMDGEVSVHIAQKDYLDYRDALAFDQLCTSLGQLFIEFIELYEKGEGVRIIDRMDDLKLPVLS